jgi:uncharacterized protein DUF3891
VIVRRVGNRLQLITQPDHAHLAARIMEHCVPLAARPRRAAILRAIAEHDNGWAEEDAAPCVDSAAGTILDFVAAPLSVRHAVWPRGVARLADDPWVAALVAQHALTVYDRFRSQVEWNSFFVQMEATRDRLLAKAGLPFDDLRVDYTYVRLADLISLTFCTGWTDEQRFENWTVRPSGPRVSVSPRAFGVKTIPIEIAAKDIPDQPFRSNAALRSALSGAKIVTLRGEVGG